jgi:hypothetical protein
LSRRPWGDERLDREPKGRLLAYEKPERAQVRKPSRLRHQQAESLDAAALGRSFEQLAHGVDRHDEFGLVETARRQSEFAQHARGIEACRAGHVGIVRKARATDEDVGHDRACLSRKNKSMSSPHKWQSAEATRMPRQVIRRWRLGGTAAHGVRAGAPTVQVSRDSNFTSPGINRLRPILPTMHGIHRRTEPWPSTRPPSTSSLIAPLPDAMRGQCSRSCSR